MIESLCTLDGYHFCLADLLTISSQPVSLFSRFRKWKEFIWNSDCGKSRFIRLVHQENCLSGTGCHTHATADTVYCFVYCRKGSDVLSDLDAVLWTCILTWVAWNILCTFHHRMYPNSVGNTWESFDFIICHKSMLQKIHGNINAFLCLLDKFSTILRCKHTLT